MASAARIGYRVCHSASFASVAGRDAINDPGARGARVATYPLHLRAIAAWRAVGWLREAAAHLPPVCCRHNRKITPIHAHYRRPAQSKADVLEGTLWPRPRRCEGGL